MAKPDQTVYEWEVSILGIRCAGMSCQELAEKIDTPLM